MPLKKAFGRTARNTKTAPERKSPRQRWADRVVKAFEKASANADKLLTIDEINEEVARIRGR